MIIESFGASRLRNVFVFFGEKINASTNLVCSRLFHKLFCGGSDRVLTGQFFVLVCFVSV